MASVGRWLIALRLTTILKAATLRACESGAMVAHLLPKQVVAGSSPVSRSTSEASESPRVYSSRAFFCSHLGLPTIVPTLDRLLFLSENVFFELFEGLLHR